MSRTESKPAQWISLLNRAFGGNLFFFLLRYFGFKSMSTRGPGRGDKKKYRA